MAPSTLKSQWWNWVARQKMSAARLAVEDAEPAPDNVVALASRRI